MSRRHSLPAEIYALVEQTPATVLLEGSAAIEKPWTQLFLAPLFECTANTPAEIPRLFATLESAVAAGRCAAGFFTYECAICFEPKAARHELAAGAPLAWFGIYERSFVFDHSTGQFAGGAPAELEGRHTTPTDPFADKQETSSKKHEVSGRDLPGSPATGLRRWGGLSRAENAHRIDGALAPENGSRLAQSPPPESRPELTAGFALTESDYAERIAAIHDYIRSGDVYQLNFTAPFRVNAPGSVAAHYARLRARQPANYGAFIHWRPGHRILSFSPELFFRIDRDGENRRIVTRPMKGTAPRGRFSSEDREIAQWLRNDAKNRAENIMIVDLLRNDLGRVARFGTVRAENLFAVERYPTLLQMTSTVTADLRPEVGFHDVFRALFPSGSVTGAPKVRSMQLLAGLEGAPRGVYTGAIGFFSPQQTVFNVAIRTLELENGTGTFGAGSGIVIDSEPAAEFRECLLKAEFLTSAAGVAREDFELLESLLWRGEYSFLEQHLDRLLESAEYFGFACDREAARAALLDYAAGVQAVGPRKVRLLLAADGALRVESEAVATETLEPSARPLRARMARTQTHSDDRMLYHKTTHRPLYAEELAEAQREGYDEVIFRNERDEITEGAHNNVLADLGGRLITPPVECGLLAGVYRRHLLETRPEIEERVLTLDDLRAADAVYLTNAVRGLRQVEVVW